MVSSQAGRALTMKEANKVMADNQRQSPLLRLPGELRNEIWKYIFADTVIAVHRRPEPPENLQLTPQIGKRGSYMITTPPHIANMAQICRQIHAETRLLPFYLTTFQVCSDGSLAALMDALEDRQQNAIVTVQITTQDANVGGMLLEKIIKWPSNDYSYQEDHLDLLEWMESLPFHRLPGLRRVIVEEDGQWTYRAAGEAMLRAGIAHCLKGREVDIVVPPSVG